MHLSTPHPESGTITCQHFTEAIEEYLNGELSDTSDREFTHHLGGCKRCLLDLHRYRKVLQLAHELPQLTLPPHLLRHLRSMLALS